MVALRLLRISQRKSEWTQGYVHISAMVVGMIAAAVTLACEIVF